MARQMPPISTDQDVGTGMDIWHTRSGNGNEIEIGMAWYAA